MKYVHRIADIPQHTHFALFSNGQVSVPGDERSRTNPGHGYPGHVVSFVEYLAFDSQEELSGYLQTELGKGRLTEQRVLQITPVKIQADIHVRLTTSP